MKTKSKFIIGLAVLGLAGVLITGCTTTTTVTPNGSGGFTTNTVTTLDPVRTANAIHATIPPAVKLTLAQKPELRKYIVDAKIAICALSDSGKVSPDDLAAAVNQTGIKQIQTPEAQAAIAAVYGIYQAYYGDVINEKLSSNQKLAAIVPVLQAICDALGEGLAAAPPGN